jgi:hypothetical protein
MLAHKRNGAAPGSIMELDHVDDGLVKWTAPKPYKHMAIAKPDYTLVSAPLIAKLPQPPINKAPDFAQYQSLPTRS